MIFDKFNRLATPLVSLAVCVSIGLSACGSNTFGEKGAKTPQGTINLDGLKVGVPEDVIKEAVLTFVLDEKPAAKAGGKSQYLSRSKDSKGGQYMAQCFGGTCYKIDSIYETAPITKDEALETVKHILPDGAPPQSKVDDSQLEKDIPSETISYGTDYAAVLTFMDKTGSKVRNVAVIDLPKMMAMSGTTEKKASEDKKDSAN